MSLLVAVPAALSEPAADDLVRAAANTTYAVTAGRVWAVMAALLALAGAVIGGLALTRSVRRVGGGGRKGAVVALVAGLIAVVNGALNLVVADGGPGTGNGVVGAGVAMVLGLVAIALGGPALARSRRTAGPGRVKETQ